MTALSDLSAADRHRAIAADFAAEADAVTDWSAPSPVDGWTARDVVAHLVDWFPGFLAAGGVTLESVEIGDDPAAAWRQRADAVQLLFDRGDDDFTHPQIGTFPLADAIDRFYTADVFMHTWDLAQADGRRPDLDGAFAERLLAGMSGIEEMLRSSGQYGPAFPAPDGADPVVRLAAFIGRDPGFVSQSAAHCGSRPANARTWSVSSLPAVASTAAANTPGRRVASSGTFAKTPRMKVTASVGKRTD